MPLLLEAQEESACLTTGFLHLVNVQEHMEWPSLTGPCPPQVLVRDASGWLSGKSRATDPL